MQYANTWTFAGGVTIYGDTVLFTDFCGDPTAYTDATYI